MPEYYPITVTRSDGLFKTTTSNGTEEANEPTASQQNSAPDEDGNFDYYKKLKPDDPKYIEWCRKLGGNLNKQLGPEKYRKYQGILSELPEGYVLWEHFKGNINQSKTSNDGVTKQKGKHAAGMFDRQDSYLYGHPQGRKKRFRSPADFYNHLLWLATDAEGDSYNNCGCKICYPEKEEAQNVGDGNEPNGKGVKAAKTSRVAPTLEQVPSSNTANSARARSQPAPTPVRSAERKSDSEASGLYLYRPGEVVWFNNGPNWRLGVIGRRGILNDKPRYLIQPLSNPFQPQASLIKDDEKNLRPWLAWSVPDTTDLQIKNAIFDQVPWQVLTSTQHYDGRTRDYIVDGSILAAKVIDASYSLFDQNKDALAGPGEVHYNGMFLGAEKVWVGEPVRLRVPSLPNTIPEMVIMIIHRMVEHNQPTSTVVLTGDVYKFVEMPTPYKNRSQWPTPALPPRMVADLRFRNEVSDDAQRGIWYEWRLLEPAAKKGLADIKGRWYETRTLLPILRGSEKYREDVAKGKLGDAGAWMNGRRDNNKVPEQRKKNRLDSLGQAVPAGFKVSRGLDGPPQDDEFPDQARDVAPLVISDLDQFMNLDGQW